MRADGLLSSVRTVQCDRVVKMIMTGGDICLLLPNRPPTFGDKVGQLRRRREALPRCLFGPPDPAETEKLLKEELQRERERFQRRWNVDLDTIEADIEKRESATKRAKLSDLDLMSKKISPSETRLPQITTEVEERLSSPSHQEEDKVSRNTTGHVPTLKKTAVYRKPCSKFQKRVRVLGSYKRQTYITEFWRSRKSMAFVFGKSKTRAVAAHKVVEPPVVD